MQHQVRDARERQRFELEADGHVAFSTYERAAGVITILHTEVPKELGGRGIGLGDEFKGQAARLGIVREVEQEFAERRDGQLGGGFPFPVGDGLGGGAKPILRQDIGVVHARQKREQGFGVVLDDGLPGGARGDVADAFLVDRFHGRNGLTEFLIVGQQSGAPASGESGQ